MLYEEQHSTFTSDNWNRNAKSSTYDKETKERQDKKLLDQKNAEEVCQKHWNLWDKHKNGLWKKKMIAKERKTTEKWKQNHDVPAEQNRKRIRRKERRDATKAT